MRRISIVLRLLILAAPIVWAGNWPQWRGPSADGISPEKNVPVEWGAGKNIAWKIPLAGLGTSTPIVWGDRVFLTAQTGDGPYEGRSGDFETRRVARRTGGLETAPRQGVRPVRDPVGARQLSHDLQEHPHPAVRSPRPGLSALARQEDGQTDLEGRARQGSPLVHHSVHHPWSPRRRT